MSVRPNLSQALPASKTRRRHQPLLKIDVFFDFICPWCMIGMRHLRIAVRDLARVRPDIGVTVRWRSYPLLPDTPIGGAPYQSAYLTRTSSRYAAATRCAEARQAGRAAGIDFDFSRLSILPNTEAAHHLVADMARRDTEIRTELLIDRIFTAYFLGGEDIGDLQALKRLGQECGMENEAVFARQTEFEKGSQQTRQTRPRRGRPANDDEVTEVPYFVFNRTVSLSGAQPPYILLNSMLRSLGS